MLLDNDQFHHYFDARSEATSIDLTIRGVRISYNKVYIVVVVHTPYRDPGNSDFFEVKSNFPLNDMPQNLHGIIPHNGACGRLYDEKIFDMKILHFAP